MLGNGLQATASIAWTSQDADIGMAAYQAAPNYVWGYEVNLVAVTPIAGGTLVVRNARVPRPIMYANESFTISGPTLSGDVCLIDNGNVTRLPDTPAPPTANAG